MRIFKNCHYSTFIPRIYKKKRYLSKIVNVSFTDSCKYTTLEKSLVNKLWGFSCGLFGVHKNSIRFGWTFNDSTGLVDIWYYIYRNGTLNKAIIGSVKIDQYCYFQITMMEKAHNLYEIQLLSSAGTKEFLNVYIPSFKYLWELGFYFGGKMKAPHTMKINFKRIC